MYLKVFFLTLWSDIKRHRKGHVVYLPEIQVRPGASVDAAVFLVYT